MSTEETLPVARGGTKELAACRGWLEIVVIGDTLNAFSVECSDWATVFT
jgi:hypothetical protein